MLDTVPSTGTYWLVDSSADVANVRVIPVAARAMSARNDRVCIIIFSPLYLESSDSSINKHIRQTVLHKYSQQNKTKNPDKTQNQTNTPTPQTKPPKNPQERAQPPQSTKNNRLTKNNQKTTKSPILQHYQTFHNNSQSQATF